MALNINGVEPTTIIYNGTDLTAVNYGTTGVWGKPYSLTYTASNCTITVTRTASPFQHAATSVTLTSGSKIYHSDTIKIVVTPSSSTYKINSVKINGSEKLDGNVATYETNWVVTGAITITATAAAGEDKTWVTKFSGSKAYSHDVSIVNIDDTPTSGFSYINIPLTDFGITESATTSPIRITATVTVTATPGGSKTTTLTEYQLETNWRTVASVSSGPIGKKISADGQLRAETSNLGLGVEVSKPAQTTSAIGKVTITITKVEQLLAVVKTLSAPVIQSVVWDADDSVSVYVDNYNSVEVTANAKFYDVNDDLFGSSSVSVSANALNTGVGIRLSSSGEYESGWYVEVYYTASGYTQSTTTTYTR